MTDRIRWQETGRGGWTGHVGALADSNWLFQIWSGASVGGVWQLDSCLPGDLGRFEASASTDELKAEAERRLAEHVSSLGAIFQPEPDESAAFQVREARSVLARWDAGRDDPDGKIYDRERVLADQVKALLVIVEAGQ